MFGVEVVALVPFFVAAWRLTCKVAEQQHLIEQHEETITAQQEILERIISPNSGVSARTLAIGSVVAAGAVTAYYVSQARPSSRRGTVRPPPAYEPTPAQFEPEECCICFSNRKDTVFAPCQHFCCCWPCSQRFIGKECPVCRVRVECTQFTYVS